MPQSPLNFSMLSTDCFLQESLKNSIIPADQVIGCTNTFVNFSREIPSFCFRFRFDLLLGIFNLWIRRVSVSIFSDINSLKMTFCYIKKQHIHCVCIDVYIVIEKVTVT